MSELKYKIGDKVRIKSLDWYNENKDEYSNIRYKRDDSVYPIFFSKYMSNFCGKILTIKYVFNNSYHMEETSSCEFWTDEMIECKVGQVEEETQSKEMLKENAKHYWKVINGDSKPKFKVGDKVTLLDLYPCVVTTVEWKGNSEYVGYVYTVRGTDFGKKVKEADLVFRDVEEETKLQLKFKAGDRVFNKVTRKWVNIIEFDIETGLYIVRYDDGIQSRSLESEMIEGLVEDENNHITETVVDTVRESNDRYRIVVDDRFDIEVDEGEYYAVRRKKEYPKTYEECCKVMGVNHTNDLDICEHCDYKTRITYYEDNLLEKIEALYRLIICRDAYWKIAGEEMGLGKPWEPDYNNEKQLKYGLYEIIKYSLMNPSQFAFPTAEMRDAFYENFKVEIEICK